MIRELNQAAFVSLPALMGQFHRHEHQHCLKAAAMIVGQARLDGGGLRRWHEDAFRQGWRQARGIFHG